MGMPSDRRARPAEAAAARRQEVKPQPKAAAKAQKPTAKAPAKKAAKPVRKAAPAAAKPAARKPAAPASAKTASPARPKPRGATSASAGKAAARSASAPAAKPATKAAPPAPPKAVRQASAPAAPGKAPAKAKAKAAAPQKTTGSIAGKPPTAALPGQDVRPQATPSSTRPPAPHATVGSLMPKTAPGMPVRATRPSARLTQVTVPSMAQAVASTAAKASYLQTPSPNVLTPPPPAPVKKDPKLANNWKTKSPEQLTDAEILAMPEPEYMNDKQMAFFRLKLVKLKQDILTNAGETTEHLREETVIVPDPADRATIEEEHALELRTRDRERKLLKKIEQSIARIDAGDYGYCDETGEPIGVGRLLARPTATLSLEAQQRRELKQKMFGD
jgi:DnaK suppressor protein